MAEARFDEACKHILTLKTSVKRLELKPDRVQQEKQKNAGFCEKWQHAKLQLAQMKGKMSKQIATMEKDLTHANEAHADEKKRYAALQVRAWIWEFDGILITGCRMTRLYVVERGA